MRKVTTIALTSLGVATLSLVTHLANATETSIADFEGATLSSWAFSNGPEFPGAQGSLGLVNGHSGSAARLTYSLAGGGNYVSATLSLSTPLRADAIALWLRNPATTRVALRLADSTGQTLQYEIRRSLEGSFSAGEWYRIVVDLSAPTNFYSGANDGVPHPPYTSLGVLATRETGDEGFIEFDEVSSLVGLSAGLGPDLPLIPAPNGAGELRSRLGVSIHELTAVPSLDIARDAGFSTVRLDLLWQYSELTPGVYNFQGFDGFVRQLAARNMRLHLILDYANPLYPAVGAADFANVTIPAFAALARAAAQHFAGLGVTYEIWNEPNASNFWPPTVAPAIYASLCKAAIAAVHAGDPDAKVTTGGTSGIDIRFIQTLIENGGAIGTNGIGVHPYRTGGGESVGHDLFLLRAMMAGSSAASQSVWDTEWGYSSAQGSDGHSAVARTRQAQLVARELLSAWAVGFPLIVYYDLRDDGTDGANVEHNFGLVQNDFSDKPAAVAVRTLSSIANGRTYAGLLQTGISSLHGMRLDGPNDVMLAVWSDNTRRPTKITFPAQASARDFLGATHALTQTGGGLEVSLAESDGPLYVTFPSSTSPTGSAGVASSPASAAGSAGAAPGNTAPGTAGSMSSAMGGVGSLGSTVGPMFGTDTTLAGRTSSSNVTGGGVSGAALGQAGNATIENCNCSLAKSTDNRFGLFFVATAWLAFNARRRQQRLR